MTAPWTDPPDFTALEKLRSADLNALLRDNLKYLKAQADAAQGGAKIVTQEFGAVLNLSKSPGQTFDAELAPSALTIPYAGVVITKGVLQCKQVNASYVRAEVSAAGGGLTMAGGSWVWEIESTFHGLRGQISFEFFAVVEPGPWAPTVEILNHADSSDDLFLDQIAGTHFLTSNYGGLIEP